MLVKFSIRRFVARLGRTDVLTHTLPYQTRIAAKGD
jgi:hypothetical protein